MTNTRRKGVVTKVILYVFVDTVYLLMDCYELFSVEQRYMPDYMLD